MGNFLYPAEMCESGKGELRCTFLIRRGGGGDEIGTVFFSCILLFWSGGGRNKFSPVFYGVSRVSGGGGDS